MRAALEHDPEWTPLFGKLMLPLQPSKDGGGFLRELRTF